MKQLLCILSAVVLLTACRQQDGGEQGPQNEFQFRTYIEDGGQLHPVAASRALAGNLSDGYRLSTLLTTGDYPAATHKRLMWNVAMHRDGSYQSATEKRYFWAVGDATLRHSFVGYSANPSGVAAGDGVDPATLAVGSDGQVRVEYLNPHDPAKQIDLLYSDNVRNVKVSSSAPLVDLVFKHRLARVVFKLMGTGDVSLGSCQAQVGYKASTVRNSAIVSLSDNTASGIQFNNTFHYNGTYNLGSLFSLPSSATTPLTSVYMGDMILLPQNLVQGWATLTLTYTPDGGSAKSASLELPALDLSAAAGQQHEVVINVIEYNSKLSVTDITLTDWNSKKGAIDLEEVSTVPNPPGPSDYITVHGLKWAKGNLIGDNVANCKVGRPTDHGLYFKFGSLVGWTGGSTGDGTGVSANDAAASVYTKPDAYVGSTTWAGVSFHNATSAVPIPATDNVSTAIGDPCRFYLGIPWRTPTQVEFESLKYSSWTTNSGVTGVWAGVLTSGQSESNSVFFSAPGNRNNDGGAMRQAGQVGGYLAATWHSDANNKALYFTSSTAPNVDNYLRTRGYPVRCVSGTYVEPTNPVHPPTASDYVEIDGLKWTKGNLVASSKTANNTNGCKVGAPTDGGLYFQFGSLIGYKGGNSSFSGTGQGTPSYTSGCWGGAGSWSWGNDAMVWPTKMAGTPSSWPQATSGTAHQWYFSGNGVSSGTINVTDPTKGVGDPCTYYLGSPWRLPTPAEYLAVFDNASNGASFPTANWSWVTSPYNGAQYKNNSLYVPASGRRHYSDGSFYAVTTSGFGWSSSVYTATFGLSLYFDSSWVHPQGNGYRADGFPVRCVSGTYVEPTNPVHPPTASDYVEIDGLKWTKGNLVASSGTAGKLNGCKVGAPTDGGLYFQFGSLIGYKGGNSSFSGTGQGTPSYASGCWGGAGSWSWGNDAMVWPTKMAGTPSSWPQATSGTAHQWYFSGNGVSSGTINVTDPTKGVGDPCTYYLGSPWRLPTAAEYKAVFDNVGNDTGWSSVPNWSWVTSPSNGAQYKNNSLYVPASGYRSNSNGSFGNVTVNGYGWSSSVSNATYGLYLNFSGSVVYPQSGGSRSLGFPVRCVSTAP